MRFSLAFLIAVSGLAQVAPTPVGKAPNSSAFDSKVYFAGQPEPGDFAEYAKHFAEYAKQGSRP